MNTHIIPVARLSEASIAELTESQLALEAAILTLSDMLEDLHCDGAELDRERSAYSQRELAQGFADIEASVNTVNADLAVDAYTLVHTLKELRGRS